MWNPLEHLEARFGGGGAVGAGGLPTHTGGKLVELPVSYLGGHRHHGHHSCVQEDSHPLKVESLKLFDGTAWLVGGWDPGPPCQW